MSDREHEERAPACGTQVRRFWSFYVQSLESYLDRLDQAWSRKREIRKNCAVSTAQIKKENRNEN
jgi:hypothetical protein